MAGIKVLVTSGDSSIRGLNTLQCITKGISGLLESKLITPTRTRKFLATLLQLLDMNDAELNWMTSHIGHSKDVYILVVQKGMGSETLNFCKNLIHV